MKETETIGLYFRSFLQSEVLYLKKPHTVVICSQNPFRALTCPLDFCEEKSKMKML